MRFLVPTRVDQLRPERRPRYRHRLRYPGWPPPGYRQHRVCGQHPCPARGALPDLGPVLKELRRVLKPKGVLRLGLPDLDRTIQAYLREKSSYFLIPDEEAKSLGAKFVIHLIWYGYTRTFFTHDFIEEQCLKAGFGRVERCHYGETQSSYPGIVELDNREEESLFVEAIK